MDARMIEAGLIDQITTKDTSYDLREWKKATQAKGTADALDTESKARVQHAYVSRLAALLQVELAGTI